MFSKIGGRKFILALLAGLLVFANKAWDLGLTEADITSIITVFGSFIAAEGIADVVERVRKVREE